MRKALFIDRDGVLNKMVYDDSHGLMDSPRLPSQVEAMPGAGHFLSQIREWGYLIVVVTNQPGVAKGTLTASALEAVNQRLAQSLALEGGKWDDIRICPHHPEYSEHPCDCRKPKPGLITSAAQEHGIDLSKSWMMGDGVNDIQAGCAAGCRTILFTNLKVEQIERFLRLQCTPDLVAGRFEEVIAGLKKVDGLK